MQCEYDGNIINQRVDHEYFNINHAVSMVVGYIKVIYGSMMGM